MLEILKRALAEDIGSGDVTSLALVRDDTRGRAVMLPRQPCLLAGVGVAARAFKLVDEVVEARTLLEDGALAEPNRAVLEVIGPARPILAAERVALNFVQRMSGIATLTREYVRCAGRAIVLDTRKTTPGLRVLEKYAVECGGGHNHRMGLYDRILIKDNHRALWRRQGGGSLAAAIEEARRKYPELLIEVEVESEEDLREVLKASPDWVLLDNLSPEQMARCVEICRGRCKVEASGGVTLEQMPKIVAAGVDAVSVGALTHSAPAIDFTLEWME